VRIDRPDDADAPSGEHPDRLAGRAGAPADSGRQADGTQVESRSRQEYYEDLHAVAAIEEQTEPGGRSEPGAPSKAEERTENGQQPKTASWEATAELSRWMWGEYKRRWPPEERAQVDKSGDPPGSWRGESGRFLDSVVNARIEAECDRIAKREEDKISPAMRYIESQDSDRQLIGFEDRLKGRDRINEKIYNNVKLKSHSPEEAISLLSDTIRYTFQYDEARYTQGVLADIARMKECGFQLDKLKNFWSDDQYKGINSQWIEPESGQRFELQFHTNISFEAKQITHGAYERLRTKQADALEELVLDAFQKKVTAAVPVPSGATDIPDYRDREHDAR
jgi:hypothetical protein